jgi:hypothetical protein
MKVYRGVANRAITGKDLKAGSFVEMGTTLLLNPSQHRTPKPEVGNPLLESLAGLTEHSAACFLVENVREESQL